MDEVLGRRQTGTNPVHKPTSEVNFRIARYTLGTARGKLGNFPEPYFWPGVISVLRFIGPHAEEQYPPDMAMLGLRAGLVPVPADTGKAALEFGMSYADCNHANREWIARSCVV
jgi:hypothetical protein